MAEHRLVYDSDLRGSANCPGCGKRLDRCNCDRIRQAASAASRKDIVPRDGVVRIARDRKGRGGKTVTVVTGLPGLSMVQVATDLKRMCGTGGAVKADAVEIQGDHRERVAAALRAWGYAVKQVGG